MQFKAFSFLAVGATLAAATAAPQRRGGGGGGGIPVSQCNTSNIQCCNSAQQANVPAVAALLGLLGIVVQDVTALVGLTCSGISVIALQSNACTAQPVCCTNNNFNGVVALGCTPINISL